MFLVALGIVGIVASCLPLYLGFPANACAILLGTNAWRRHRSRAGIVGAVLGIIGLVLTVLNLVLGAPLGIEV